MSTWTADELETLRINYADFPTFIVAWVCGKKSLSDTYRMAHKLALRKSEGFHQSDWSGRLKQGTAHGACGRFRKGHAPANKGLRRPGYVRGRMAETQFKKGSRPHTWKPIGSTRINADGYLDRKIADTGYPPRDWKGVHVLLWEEHLGPVPPGHVICFKNGNKTDIRIDNLQCISRRERMRRNSFHNRYPKEIGLLIQQRAVLVRAINKRARHEQ